MGKLLYFTVSKKGRYSYDRINAYATKMAEQKRSIPATPQPVTDEIITMVTRISDVYLSSIVYPPNYFERKYLIQKRDHEKDWYNQLSAVYPQLGKWQFCFLGPAHTER